MRSLGPKNIFLDYEDPPCDIQNDTTVCQIPKECVHPLLNMFLRIFLENFMDRKNDTMHMVPWGGQFINVKNL